MEDYIFGMEQELSKKDNYTYLKNIIEEEITRHFKSFGNIKEYVPSNIAGFKMVGVSVELIPGNEDSKLEIIVKPDHSEKDRKLRLMIAFRGNMSNDEINLDNHREEISKVFQREMHSVKELLRFRLNHIKPAA